MKNATLIVVPGLFGGVAKKCYKPLAEMCGSKDFLLFRAGADWEPEAIAEKIRQVKGKKIVVCISLGAIVGNIVALDENTKVFYICPFLGIEYLNYDRKGLYAFHRMFKGLAKTLMRLSESHKNHRWWPLYGGTKPDRWFLSTYALAKQFTYLFSEAPEMVRVDGVVYSHGDKFVEPSVAMKTSWNTSSAWTANGKGGPAHANLRREGDKFGRPAKNRSGELSHDAKAYMAALHEVMIRSH